MMRKMKMKKHSHIGNPESFKNAMRLRLLVALPAFQNEIDRIREEFKIPVGGFQDDESYAHWYNDWLVARSDEIMDSKKFIAEDAAINRALGKTIGYSEFRGRKQNLYNTVPLEAFRNNLSLLAEQFHLPTHFVSRPPEGLETYVTRGRIVPPSNNWMVELDPVTRGQTARWLAIKIFAPLSKKELQDAFKLVQSLHRNRLPKEMMATPRFRKQFERDLRLWEQLRLRRAQPIKRRYHLPGSYLDRLKKGGKLEKLSSEVRRSLEKEHGSKARTGFDQPTSRAIGKKEGASAEATRKAIERLNKTAFEWFGVGLSKKDIKRDA